MKRWTLPAIAAALIAAPAAAERPKLVVQITFDQLRGDLLERYRPALSGGLKRVLDQGWWVQRGEAAHGLTVSWPGHGTLATGMYPSHHGFTANEWWEKVGDRWTEIGAGTDPKTRVLGRRRRRREPVADWKRPASATGSRRPRPRPR